MFWFALCYVLGLRDVFVTAGLEVGYGDWRKHTTGRLSDTFQTTGRQSDFRLNHRWVMCNYPFLFSLFHSLLWPILAWNEAVIVFFNFLNFSLFYWNFLLRIVLERNGTIIFIFSLSLPFSTYCGCKRCHDGVFLICLLFFLVIFYYASGRNETEW